MTGARGANAAECVVAALGVGSSHRRSPIKTSALRGQISGQRISLLRILGALADSIALGLQGAFATRQQHAHVRVALRDRVTEIDLRYRRDPNRRGNTALTSASASANLAVSG